MQFKCLALLTVALSIRKAQGALTANDVVNSIHNITEFSSDTLDVVKDLSPANVVPNGLKVVENLGQIVTDVANYTAATVPVSGSPPFAYDDQLNICGAFNGFVKVHQELLKTLIGRKDVLSTIPLTTPVAAVLRTLEGRVDKLANGIIGLVPNCASQAEKESKELDGTFSEAFAAFPFQLHGVVGSLVGASLGGVGGQ